MGVKHFQYISCEKIINFNIFTNSRFSETTNLAYFYDNFLFCIRKFSCWGFQLTPSFFSADGSQIP